MKWLCRHRWIVLEKFALPAPIDKAMDISKSIGQKLKAQTLDIEWFEERHRAIMSCQKCGTVKVERIN